MDFSNLLACLENEIFGEEKNDILRSYSQYFTAAQMVQVIDQYIHAPDKIGALEIMMPKVVMLSGQDGKAIVSAFSFPDNKLRAVKLIASHVDDPCNKYAILEAIDFHFDCEEARKILDETIPLNQGVDMPPTGYYPPIAVQVEIKPPQQVYHNYYSPPKAQPMNTSAYPPQATPYPSQQPPQPTPYPPPPMAPYPSPSSAPYPPVSPSNTPYPPPQATPYPPPTSTSALYPPPSSDPYSVPPQMTPYPPTSDASYQTAISPASVHAGSAYSPQPGAGNQPGTESKHGFNIGFGLGKNWIPKLKVKFGYPGAGQK